METFLVCILAGVAVGFFAGLFGVGGGIIIVPILNFLFQNMSIDESILFHLAIGTSLACIFFTSISSLSTHHKKGAVLWKTLGILTPGILLGTYLGSEFAARLHSHDLKLVFVFFIILFSGKMFRDSLSGKGSESSVAKNPDTVFSESNLPGWYFQFPIGLVIGFSSALLGVGGGVFTSSYLILLKVPIQIAIGTSAGIGLPVAISGTIGFITTGWQNPALPEGSLGFVYLPALLGLVIMSLPFAKLGAKFSHSLPKKNLRILFASFLFIMGIFMGLEQIL